MTATYISEREQVDRLPEKGTTLLVNSGSVDITPSKNLQLSGYMSRREIARGAADHIEANGILISDGISRIVIISVDTLFVGDAVRQDVLNRLDGTVSNEELFMCATHTHSAPSIDSSKPLLGRADNSYIAFATDRISHLTSSILSSKSNPCELYFSELNTHSFNINRRLQKWTFGFPPRREFKMLPNLRGCKDTKLKVVQAISENGECVALVWSFACHPVAHYDRHMVSADFPGAVRSLVREGLGSKIPVIFLPGFCGDVKPNITSAGPEGVSARQRRTETFFPPMRSPQFCQASRGSYRKWTREIHSAVLAAAQDRSVRLGCEVRSALVTRPLSELGIRAEHPFWSVHLLSLGGAIIAGISAEPVSGYSALLQKTLAVDRIVPVSCAGHVFGYLPLESMLPEKGYEVTEFKKYFGVSGNFIDHNLESKVLDAFKEASEKLSVSSS